VEAIVEIETELALGNQLTEIAAGRRDDAHIDVTEA